MVRLQPTAWEEGMENLGQERRFWGFVCFMFER